MQKLTFHDLPLLHRCAGSSFFMGGGKLHPKATCVVVCNPESCHRTLVGLCGQLQREIDQVQEEVTSRAE